MFGTQQKPMFILWASLFSVVSLLGEEGYTTGFKPLTDMEMSDRHFGYQGGLYPGGSNQRPERHQNIGLDLAASLADSSEPVVLVAIGLSNTTQIFASGALDPETGLRVSESTFMAKANNDPSFNSEKVIIVDGAQGGQDLLDWLDPENPEVWDSLDKRLVQAGVTAEQPKICWLYHAQARPFKDLGLSSMADDDRAPHPHALKERLEALILELMDRYPNQFKAFYISSREHPHTSDVPLNPEPYSYEGGFAVKWLIEDQIKGECHPRLNYDIDPQAPWLSWGPYTWADGSLPRSDGFTYRVDAVQPGDKTHPSPAGALKIACHLLNFFKTDPTCAPWFLKPSQGAGPELKAWADASGGQAGVTIEFEALAPNASGLVDWNFADGTFAQGSQVSKTFHSPGHYLVRALATDKKGESTCLEIPVPINWPPVLGMSLNDQNQVTILFEDGDGFEHLSIEDLVFKRDGEDLSGPFRLLLSNPVFCEWQILDDQVVMLKILLPLEGHLELSIRDLAGESASAQLWAGKKDRRPPVPPSATMSRWQKG